MACLHFQAWTWVWLTYELWTVWKNVTVTFQPLLCCTSITLWNRILLKIRKKYNFDEKINLPLESTIFPVICTGFSLQRLLFQLVQNFKALPSFWRTPWFPKQSYCTPSPPPNGCSSARSTPTWPQASFNNSIRFACSSEVNVFTVSHLDFIKGVGTKALTKVEKLIWRVWNVWNS